MKAKPKDLIGRIIVAVELNPFERCVPGEPRTYVGANKYAHDPRITLDNGSVLYFVTEETEVGEYGTQLCISRRPRRRRSAKE